jgi:medium-chain acyl-[acyl-carrier-protein] hydrolase
MGGGVKARAPHEKLMAARWFLPVRAIPASERALRVLCLPYAGAPLRCFRWLEACAGDDVELWTASLPGRAMRYGEPAHTSVASIVAALLEELSALCDEPYVLYGHSMGTVLAFELARAARQRGLRLPVALVLSGARSPDQFLVPCDPPRWRLPQAQFVDYLRLLGGMPAEVLAYPELLNLALPALRADYEACETYLLQPQPPLPVAMAVLGGTDDREVTVESQQGWRAHAAGPFVHRSFLGDHFFINAQRPELPLFMATLLRDCKAGTVTAWSVETQAN